MRKFRRIFLPLIYLAIIICIKTSCENNLIANIPSYIEIEHFNYYGSDNSTIPHTDGYENYQSTNISDVWVSMDGQMLGVFEIPCKIPILEEGMHALDIYAGIKVNGISGARIKYPFYEKFETDVLLESENSLTLSPNTSYQNSTLFQFEEQGQFEMPGNMLEKSILSDTIAIIQDQVVFQGNKSVGIYLDSINTYFNIRNVEEIQLNNNSFLEFNFKSNINFNVGLII